MKLNSDTARIITYILKDNKSIIIKIYNNYVFKSYKLLSK